MRGNWNDWVHAVWSTRGHWLPGDPRGFRDHDHRVHSTGHYKDPPPPGEHAALYRHARRLCPGCVELPEQLRSRVALVLGEKLLEIGASPRIIAVARVHVHSLLCVGQVDVAPFVGRAKQAASHAVRGQLPGRIWGQGCHPTRIRNQAHYREVVDYIAAHQREGAALWVHPDLRRASGQASSQVCSTPVLNARE